MKQGKQLLRDVAVVDAPVPNRLSGGSVGNPGTAAADSKERKCDKFKFLIDKDYPFKPLAFEVQGSVGWTFYRSVSERPLHNPV